MIRNLLYAACVLLAVLTACTGTGKSATRELPEKKGLKRPDWISRGETDSHRKTMFWMGVGTGDTPEQAAQSARQEVAAQIRTHVRSRITDVARMQGGSVRERFESISQNITDTKLEGLEIIERYSGRRRCYALAGLNKSVYLGRISDRISELYGKAKESYSQALDAKKEGAFPVCYSRLSRARSSISDLKNPEYFYRSFIRGGTDAGNAAFRLEREISGEISAFLAGVKAEKRNDNQKGAQGEPVAKSLECTFTVFGKPLSGFPVEWKTVRGRAEYEASQRTDSKGITACRVTRIDQSPVQRIRISCSLDVDIPDAAQEKYVRPETLFSIQADTVSQWLIYVDEPGGKKVIMSLLVSDMRTGGVQVNELNLTGAFDEQAFIRQAAGKFAKYNLLTGSFTVREIDRAMGNSTSKAHGYIKGVELSSGRTVFQKRVEKAIGVSFTGDAQESALKALTAAGKQSVEWLKKELGY